MEDVADEFEAAVSRMKRVPGGSVSNEDKLGLYGLFKQVKEGDCSTSAPSRFNLVAHAKWKAWSDLKGSSKLEVMKRYIALVKKLTNGEFPVATLVETSPSSSTESAQETETEMIVKPLQGSWPSRGQFKNQVLGCLALSSIGISGFLVTTLSQQALLFLMLFMGGLLGVVGSFAALLDSKGIIALYPALMQRILLERTLAEVIMEGKIAQRIRDFLSEINPIFYCKTEEDKILALTNMSESTRKLITTRGVANLFPEWYQRILLPSQEYARQKSRLKQEAVAFRPALNVQPGGKKHQNRQEADLDAQIELSSRLFVRSVRDRAALLIVRRVNPQLCKGVSIAMALSFLVHLRMSTRARRKVIGYSRNFLLSTSSGGATFFAFLAIMHSLSKAYMKRRGISSN